MRNFFFKVLKKTGLSHSFNFYIKRTLNHTSVIVPVLGEIGKGNLKKREVWMYDLISQLVKNKNGCFVDVGVNIGQTLIHFKTAAPDAPYIGFEPNPVCVYYTGQLIAKNKWQHCTIIPCGIHESNKLMTINYYSIGTDSMATLVTNFRADRKVVKTEYVPCFNRQEVENLLSEKKITCIKIDVEGSEPEVINELNGIIMQQRPFVITELLPPNSDQDIKAQKRIEDVRVFFKQVNYRAFRIQKTKTSELHELEELDDLITGLTRENADHLFCPGEYNITMLKKFKVNTPS